MPDASTSSTSASFAWVPLFEALASKLADYEGRQRELIDFLERLRRDGLSITPLTDRDVNGEPFLTKEMDPFTFLGVANRGLTDTKRQAILREFAKFFGLSEKIPGGFMGVPVLNNQNSWIMPSRAARRTSDVSTLWEVFRLALGPDPIANPVFGPTFDRALEIRNVNFNLTMGLFWSRPRVFLSLDKKMRQYLDIQVPRQGLKFAFYAPLVRQTLKDHPEGLPALSHAAWLAEQGKSDGGSPEPRRGGKRTADTAPIGTGINYWMVGAWWHDKDPQDQTARFVDNGIWENGYTARYIEEVKSMKAGDRIAIKAAGTQRKGLPFEYGDRTASRIVIRATGTIVKNPGTGRIVEVEWDERGEERAWYFYTNRSTVWRLNPAEEDARRLIRFAFEGAQQDYSHFLREAEADYIVDTESASDEAVGQPYSLEDVIDEGAFVGMPLLQEMIRRLSVKKNLILQGAPGVGKTYLARKLAFAIMEERNDRRIWSVQFHPSYSYEDFVRGYRPGADAGGFELIDGPLLQLCEAARADPDDVYVMLIDEVNRGNTSQIFGELLALIEADKRGPANAVTPIYRRHEAERLAIPENIYFIGTMNLADRSLALVDYALRRRFAFVTLRPQFDSQAFRQWHAQRDMPSAIIDRIVAKMTQLNEVIANDPRLGPNYCIGHSFFCPRGKEFSGLDAQWYGDIVETEIVPLLEEYWFDSRDTAEREAARLLEE